MMLILILLNILYNIENMKYTIQFYIDMITKINKYMYAGIHNIPKNTILVRIGVLELVNVVALGFVLSQRGASSLICKHMLKYVHLQFKSNSVSVVQRRVFVLTIAF